MYQDGSAPPETDNRRNYGIIVQEYAVFNAGQTEDLTLPETDEELPPNPPVLNWGHHQAQYVPDRDTIEMPEALHQEDYS